MAQDSSASTALSSEEPVPQAYGFSSTASPDETVLMCEEPEPPPEIRKPCDIATLLLIDYKTGQSVRADGQLRPGPVPAKAPPRVQALLGSYDIVLERAVDYEGRTKNKPEMKMLFRGVSD